MAFGPYALTLGASLVEPTSTHGVWLLYEDEQIVEGLWSYRSYELPEEGEVITVEDVYMLTPDCRQARAHTRRCFASADSPTRPSSPGSSSQAGLVGSEGSSPGGPSLPLSTRGVLAWSCNRDAERFTSSALPQVIESMRGDIGVPPDLKELRTNA